jgi:hypothetical protein
MSATAKIFGVAAIIFSISASAGEWTPIAGIPEPSFGVVEEPPALPSPWDQETPGFYYVCSNCSGSGNTTYGTPDSPRNSMPGNISGGDVVVIAGNYGALNYNFSCSANAPCFLVGDPDNPPTVSGESQFNGSYYIVDGVHVTMPNGASGSTLGMRGDHGVFRNGKVSGTSSSGGMGTSGSDHLVMNNQIVDNGDVNASNDQDRHGIKVSGNRIWIIGNEFTRNSGDGVQVGDIGSRDQISHIYIGRNTAHNNKQTGFWVKEAQNVIISENVSYDHSPSGSSSGDCMGGQYDPRNVWMLFNEMYDCNLGIGFKSSNNGNGSGFYVIGNYIHDIDSSYNPNDAWQASSISSWNNADITIVNNTLDTVTSGINLNGNTGSTYIYNNAITNMQHPNAKMIFAADSGDVRYDDFNAGDGDQVIDAGTAPIAQSDPYTQFENLYGLSIRQDIVGNTRPIRLWDIGAYESENPPGSRPMPPTLDSVN